MCFPDAMPMTKPILHHSPMYILKSDDHVGLVLDPLLQAEGMKSPDPVYVHITALAHVEQDNSRLETQTPVCRFREVAAVGPPRSASRDSKSIQCNRSKTAEPRTLLIAYLPRNASAQEVQSGFECFGTVCSATIMRDADGRSKCFGFVRFQSHATAAAALQACQKGRVILEGEGFKAWHLKASWARTEHLKREGQPAMFSRRSAQSNGQMASKAAVGITAKGSNSSDESR